MPLKYNSVEDIEYFNGEVTCIASKYSDFIVGEKYYIKDGELRGEDGHYHVNITSVEDLNSKLDAVFKES